MSEWTAVAENLKSTDKLPNDSPLLKYPLSNNVGSVKHFLSALRHALVEERHLALVGGLRVSNLGSLFIVGVRNSVRPSHLFDHPLRS